MVKKETDEIFKSTPNSLDTGIKNVSSLIDEHGHILKKTRTDHPSSRSPQILQQDVEMTMPSEKFENFYDYENTSDTPNSAQSTGGGSSLSPLNTESDNQGEQDGQMSVDLDDTELDLPQTPPMYQASLQEQDINGVMMNIDPSSAITKMHPSFNNTSTPRSHLSSVNDTITTDLSMPFLIRCTFPVLTNETRVYSQCERDSLGQEWQVHWYPHGRPIDETWVGIFIEMVADSNPSNPTMEEDDDILIRPIEVEIILLNQDNPELSYRKVLEIHDFSKTDNESGDKTFISRQDLIDPANGLITNEGTVEVEIRLTSINYNPNAGNANGIDDLLAPNSGPTTRGNYQNNMMMYDSKRETGMVGLKNQGATCYMNSLLQTLFHLRAFRQVVYDTPSEEEDTNDSVSLALQRVFYRLQTKSKAVSTKELTRSFGWSQMDAFMQHDVQELYRILCDRLEEKMKGTAVDHTIKKLFEGKVRSFIQCVNVDFQSFRDESFYDLQLDVKGCKDIYESFRKYVEVEMLDGENQYEAEGFGKQDAKKGVRFVQCPPVLNIQLKRFEYDPMRDGMVKIHDRFEFPKVLVLDEFFSPLKETEPQKKPSYEYHLHSVLVHSGDVHGGHYYVFVRPGKNIAMSEQWYKFDDDLISTVDEAIAIEGNYGSGGATNMEPLNETDEEADDKIDSPSKKRVYDDISMSSNTNGYNGPQGEYGNALLLPSPTTPTMSLGRSFSSAYMLVYVRNGENDVTSIREEPDELKSSSEADADEVPIPQILRDRFHEEENAAAKRKKQQQTEHLYMNFRIASDWSVKKLRKISKAIDFSSFNNKSALGMRLKRTVPIRELYQTIYKRTGVPLDRMRLWKVITRENRTHRPDSPLNEDSLDSAVESLIDDDVSPKAAVRLYLQILPETKDHSSAQINRYFWNDFASPTLSNSEEEGTTLNLHEPAFRNQEDENDQITDEEAATYEVHIPEMSPQDILLFIKFYDVKKKLGERLEYMGNVLIDSRKTGAELAKYIHEVLDIPFTRGLMLYEEIHPMSVSEIDMDLSLESADIQHGDIICFQYSDDYEEAAEKQTNGSTTTLEDRYPNVSFYFKYLLDRCDVAFQQLGAPEDDHFVLNLLYSHVYNDIYGAVADHLGLENEKRLHLRLYQHSPLTGLPKKAPLRHSKFSEDDQTTLEDFLTEYAERTNIMYYELLSHPITEIESKKQILVYLSCYDEQLTDPQQSKQAQRIEVLVPIESNVRQVLSQVRQELGIDMNVALRACEVVNNGTLITQILKETEDVVKYAIGTKSYTPLYQAGIFIELITNEEVTMEQELTDSVSPTLYRVPVVHFSYQATNHQWIQTHGVPMIVPFFGHEFVAEVLERIRNRMGTPTETFKTWNLSLVKDGKAVAAPKEIEALRMTQLEDESGKTLNLLQCLGLEHADPTPPTPKHGQRRQELGIKIR